MVTREKQQKTGLLSRFSAVFDGILCDYKTRFRIERVSRGLTGYRQEYSDAVPCRRCVPGSILGKLPVLLLAAAVSVPFQASAAESATAAAAPEAGDEYGEEEDDDSLSPEELYNAGLEGLGGQSETMTCDGGLSLLLEAAVDGYAPAQAALGTAYYQGRSASG